MIYNLKKHDNKEFKMKCSKNNTINYQTLKQEVNGITKIIRTIEETKVSQ